MTQNRNLQVGKRLPRPAPLLIKWDFTQEDQRPETVGSNHVHWVVTAFMKLDDDNNMVDSVTISVEAEDEEKAITRAMKLVERAHYRITSVTEICTKDEALKNGI